jgi:hypothetical protein
MATTTSISASTLPPSDPAAIAAPDLSSSSPCPTRRLQLPLTSLLRLTQTTSCLAATQALTIPLAGASTCWRGSDRKQIAACAGYRSLCCHHRCLAGEVRMRLDGAGVDRAQRGGGDSAQWGRALRSPWVANFG